MPAAVQEGRHPDSKAGFCSSSPSSNPTWQNTETQVRRHNSRWIYSLKKVFSAHKYNMCCTGIIARPAHCNSCTVCGTDKSCCTAVTL